ncbi:hypothetical protein B0H10DRAFT_1980501 [Mycena sp. CBHHK59/15]|nr:hypothetical protein B0H10DRAFT_1980501 [Mycena sp. CBHHK59/15]
MTVMHSSTLWFYFAQFFTHDILVGLMTAGLATPLLGTRVDETLQEQYREVDLRFLHLENGMAERLRKRAVADRVRVLRIGPYFVCDALDSSPTAFGEAIDGARRLVRRFRHVEEYYLMWHERPTTSLRRPAPDCDVSDILRASAFLAAPFTSTPYLRVLTVELALDKAEHLFQPRCTLPSLEELRLCIRADHGGGDIDAAGYIMVHHLARFINNAHRTLQSLSFASALSIDFSPLFASLCSFANLRSLALEIPTARPYLAEPAALRSFLCAHRATLGHLALRGFANNNGAARGAVDASWLAQCLSGVSLPALRTLDVGTSFVPLEVAMLCIGQFADTLAALDIMGQYLDDVEVVDVLRALKDRPRLRALSVGVVCLIRGVAPRRGEQPVFVGGKRNSRKLKWWQDDFCAEMSSHTYAGWGLRDLQCQHRYVDAVCESLVRK